MIRRCNHTDFAQIWAVINDGAQAYRGIIPADRWAEPYMSEEKLQHEIDAGVVFWGFEEDESPSRSHGHPGRPGRRAHPPRLRTHR